MKPQTSGSWNQGEASNYAPGRNAVAKSDPKMARKSLISVLLEKKKKAKRVIDF